MTRKVSANKRLTLTEYVQMTCLCVSNFSGIFKKIQEIIDHLSFKYLELLSPLSSLKGSDEIPLALTLVSFDLFTAFNQYLDIKAHVILSISSRAASKQSRFCVFSSWGRRRDTLTWVMQVCSCVQIDIDLRVILFTLIFLQVFFAFSTFGILFCFVRSQVLVKVLWKSVFT